MAIKWTDFATVQNKAYMVTKLGPAYATLRDVLLFMGMRIYNFICGEGVAAARFHSFTAVCDHSLSAHHFFFLQVG